MAVGLLALGDAWNDMQLDKVNCSIYSNAGIEFPPHTHTPGYIIRTKRKSSYIPIQISVMFTSNCVYRNKEF